MKRGKLKTCLIHSISFNFKINRFVFSQADEKKTDLRLNNETSSNKEKGNVINSELGSETCDTHTWCDARLGD